MIESYRTKKIKFSKSIVFPSALLYVFFGFGDNFLGSKLSISNIVEIVFVLCFLFRYPLRYKEVGFLLFFTISVCLSYIYVLLKYDFHGKYIISFFFLISILFIFLYKKMILTRDLYLLSYFHALRISILLTIPLYLFMGLYQHFSLGFVSFFMDDKSHASVLLCFLSFVSLFVFKRGGILISFILWFLTLLTLSRFSIIFFPFLILFYVKIFSKNNAFGIKKILSLFLFFLIATAFLVLVFQNLNSFKVLSRVSSTNTIEQSSSTIAHFLLLEKAVELKFNSIGNFIFGVSPGNFADILIRSTVSYSDIQSLDPLYIAYAKIGMAPIHSTYFAFFCEFPIFIFIVLLVYWVNLHYRCYKSHYRSFLFFLIPFNVPMLFYSCHNKFYFFVIIATIEIFIKSQRIGVNVVSESFPSNKKCV